MQLGTRTTSSRRFNRALIAVESGKVHIPADRGQGFQANVNDEMDSSCWQNGIGVPSWCW